MTDREMLELAAKAAGLKEHGWMGPSYCHVVDNTWATFDPLTDDGDAFRLLCDKSIRIVESNGGAYRAVQFTVHPETADEAVHEVEIEWPHTPAATRFAITRAAAEIGKAMP